MSQSDAPGDGMQQTSEDANARAGAAPSKTAEPRPRGGGRLVASVALVVALGAAAAAGFFGLQHGALYESLTSADGAAEEAVERLAARLDGLEDELATTAASLEAAAREREGLEARLEETPEPLAALERRVDALAGGSREARERWLEAEAEYYLELANAELALASDWRGAVTALELADTRLRELGDPRLTGVREAIAEERLALEAVERTDVEGLALRLSRLAELADTLPLRGAATLADTGGPAASPDAEPGLSRLWSGLRNAASSLVRIERRDEPVARALSADEERLVRRRLAANLDVARLALVRREPGVYAAGLATARALVEREFDTHAPAVTAMLDELAELGAAEIAPAKPDIGTSLARLRSLTDGAR